MDAARGRDRLTRWVDAARERDGLTRWADAADESAVGGRGARAPRVDAARERGGWTQRAADAAGETAVVRTQRENDAGGNAAATTPGRRGGSIPLRLGDPGFHGQAAEQDPDRVAEDAIQSECGEKRQHPVAGHGGDEAGFHGLQLS